MSTHIVCVCVYVWPLYTEKCLQDKLFSVSFLLFNLFCNNFHRFFSAAFFGAIIVNVACNLCLDLLLSSLVFLVLLKVTMGKNFCVTFKIILPSFHFFSFPLPRSVEK